VLHSINAVTAPASTPSAKHKQLVLIDSFGFEQLGQNNLDIFLKNLAVEESQYQILKVRPRLLTRFKSLPSLLPPTTV
jgi:hypothetical protein